jgi:hypothetical protein
MSQITLTLLLTLIIGLTTTQSSQPRATPTSELEADVMAPSSIAVD